jgi:uncharacterized phage protein (TIGR01671 family)
MAREIKFRAWDGKRMRDVFKMLYLTANTSVHFIDTQENEPGYLMNSDERLSLMQYTGLKDKHGDPIYEGDVCSCRIEGTETHIEYVHGHVHYNETVGAFGYKTTDGRFFGLNSKILLSAEIVGNIYEHQHLFPPCTH